MRGSRHWRASRLPSPRARPRSTGGCSSVAALWADGTAALNGGSAAIALERFESASRLAPGGKIYELNAVLSLAALDAWPQVDTRLSAIYADWVNDIRLPAAMAMIGIARRNLAQAEEWLRARRSVPDVLGQQLLDRLRRDQIDAALLADLRSDSPTSGRTTWRHAARRPVFLRPALAAADRGGGAVCRTDGGALPGARDRRRRPGSKRSATRRSCRPISARRCSDISRSSAPTRIVRSPPRPPEDVGCVLSTRGPRQGTALSGEGLRAPDRRLLG